ncbi:hypothetical protein D3C81_1887290 [compost metagenome]
MPGLFRQVQAQLDGQRLRHWPGLFTEGGEAAGGTAELQAEQTRLEFGQTLAVSRHGAQPAGDLHAQRHWRRVLQPGAPGQRRVGVALRLLGQPVGQRGQIALQQTHRSTQL